MRNQATKSSGRVESGFLWPSTARGVMPKPLRGFAAMSQAMRQAISSMGGKAAHALGLAHEFDREEAAAAGRKGGRTTSQNRAHMAAIGSKGGKSRGASIRWRLVSSSIEPKIG